MQAEASQMGFNSTTEDTSTCCSQDYGSTKAPRSKSCTLTIESSRLDEKQDWWFSLEEKRRHIRTKIKQRECQARQSRSVSPTPPVCVPTHFFERDLKATVEFSSQTHGHWDSSTKAAVSKIDPLTLDGQKAWWASNLLSLDEQRQLVQVPSNYSLQLSSLQLQFQITASNYSDRLFDFLQEKDATTPTTEESDPQVEAAPSDNSLGGPSEQSDDEFLHEQEPTTPTTEDDNPQVRRSLKATWELGANDEHIPITGALLQEHEQSAGINHSCISTNDITDSRDRKSVV